MESRTAVLAFTLALAWSAGVRADGTRHGIEESARVTHEPCIDG